MALFAQLKILKTMQMAKMALQQVERIVILTPMTIN